MTKFYIADTHFGHSNIIPFDSRPFSNVEEMDEYIIHQWNKTVTKSDSVYVLGDMFWNYSNEQMIKTLRKLNGQKHLIWGNHDRMSRDVKSCFNTVSEIKEVKDNGVNVFLCHYPVLFWNKNLTENSVHLYGHVHETMEYTEVLMADGLIRQGRSGRYPRGEMINVGVMLDYMAYTPRSLDYLLGKQNNLKED